MQSIIYWQECFNSEQESLQEILSDLKLNKDKVLLKIEEEENAIAQKKLQNIERYISAFTGLISVTRNYKISVDKYLMDTFNSYHEQIELNEFLKKRTDYQFKIILNQSKKLNHYEQNFGTADAADVPAKGGDSTKKPN